MEEFRKFFWRCVPTRPPILVQRESETDRINFLSHNFSPLCLLPLTQRFRRRGRFLNFRQNLFSRSVAPAPLAGFRFGLVLPGDPSRLVARRLARLIGAFGVSSSLNTMRMWLVRLRRGLAPSRTGAESLQCRAFTNDSLLHEQGIHLEFRIVFSVAIALFNVFFTSTAAFFGLNARTSRSVQADRPEFRASPRAP